MRSFSAFSEGVSALELVVFAAEEADVGGVVGGAAHRERHDVVELQAPAAGAANGAWRDVGAAAAVAGPDLISDPLRDTMGPYRKHGFHWSTTGLELEFGIVPVQVILNGFIEEVVELGERHLVPEEVAEAFDGAVESGGGDERVLIGGDRRRRRRRVE
jgi:hypothetical protein